MATEPAIIRKEERKWLGSFRWLKANNKPHPERDAARATWDSLRVHRLNNRTEIRAALVAYGYLRGTPYRRIERAPRCLRAPFDRPGPDWGRVRALVIKYGPPITGKDEVWKSIQAWRDVPPPNEP